MQKGVLVEQGIHHELLARNGAYAELVRKHEIATTSQNHQPYPPPHPLHTAQVQPAGYGQLYQKPEEAAINDEPYNYQPVLRDARRRSSSATAGGRVSTDAYELKRLWGKAEIKKKRRQKAPLREITHQFRSEQSLLAQECISALIVGAVKPCLTYIAVRSVITVRCCGAYFRGQPIGSSSATTSHRW